jgi:hypothetical protein
VGRVNVTRVAPSLEVYPLLTAIVCVAAVTSVKGRTPAPVAATVIDPVTLVIDMPVPAVRVAAAGSDDVVPIRSCPAPSTIGEKALEPSATNTPCAVGAEMPEPPCVVERGVDALLLIEFCKTIIYPWLNERKSAY